MGRSQLVLIIIQFVVEVYASDACISESAFIRDFTFDGKLSLVSVAESYSLVPSRSHCATKCVSFTGCESFFYNDNTETCRLVSGQFTQLTELPDVETYSTYYALQIEATTTESTTEPTTESTTEPTTESTTQPTTESTTQPTTESTTQPTTESTTQPTTESTTQPTTESTTQPTTESTTQPTTESTTTESATTEEACCRYTPPVSPTGVPRIAVAQSKTVNLFDQTGNNIMTSVLPATVRAMLYHPFQERLYVGTEPVRSLKLDGTDIQTHGGDFTGTLMAFELNMFDNNMYLSISSYLVEELSPDGVYTNLANDPDVYKPRQNKIDTAENVLYWADEGFKCLKSLRLDGVSSVETVFTTTELIWALDIDFTERKIYWCARTTGKVFVYDLATSANTLLHSATTTTGSCSGLSLYDGFMYLIFYKLDFIEKRYKNGTLADTLLQGNMATSTTKYFAIIE